MKKLLPILTAALLLSGCSDLNQPDSNLPAKDAKETVTLQTLKGTSWFAGDVELQFPYQNETLYIKYLPDSMTTTKWISLEETANGSFKATIEWSENVREIGKTSTIGIQKKDGKLFVKSDIFDFSNMETFKGVTASDFAPNSAPSLKADYLSNFNGDYKLDTLKYDFSIKAKLCISQSVSSYWNANILNTTVTEDGSYDMLLAHSSAKDASGSIDPGITGKEPFVTKQGLFWNHMILTPIKNNQWSIKWSSEWKDSPYEALNTTTDMSDTFIGPESTKIGYDYKFYFGQPGKDSSGWCTVIKGDKISEYSYITDIPTKDTWKEILAYAGTVTIPEGKEIDYWWYSTNSTTSKESSYVYKLSNTTELSLKEYEFYCALKDKPATGDIYYQEGTFTQGTNTLEIGKNSLTYNETEYTYLLGAEWSTAKNGEPLTYVYLLKNGNTNYIAAVMYYTNNGQNYVKVRPPKEYDSEEIPVTNTWAPFNSLSKNFTKQE